MKPRIDLDKLTKDSYHSILSNALNDISELMKLVNNDVYAETLIKTYGQLLEVVRSNVNGCAFEDLLAMDVENGIDPDILDRSNRRDLVDFQIEQAREAIVTYLTKKINASWSGAFTHSERYDEYSKASELWYSFDNSETQHAMFENNLEALIMFVNK